MHYRVDDGYLHARLIQESHAGWVAVGFAQVANVMLGAKAIVGAPGAAPPIPQVQLYYLGGKSPSSVTPLAPSAQTLTATSLEASGNRVVMTFSMPQGPDGSLLNVLGGATNLIFAHGTATDAVSWHSARGGVTISLAHLERARFATPPPPLLPPPPSPANPAEVRVTIITATFTIDASADAFDEARFRLLLSQALGVIPSVISLTIGGGRRLAEQRELQSTGPLTVTASVYITAEPSAATTTVTATTTLNSYASDPQLASAALEVAVTSVSPPQSTVTFVTKPPPAMPAPEPSPPLASPPTNQTSGDDISQDVNEALSDEQAFGSQAVAVAVGVSVALVVVCICCIAVYLRRRWVRPLPPPPLELDDGAPSKKAKKAKQRGSVWVTFGEASKGKHVELEESISLKISSGRDSQPAPPLAPPPVHPSAIEVEVERMKNRAKEDEEGVALRPSSSEPEWLQDAQVKLSSSVHL